METTVLQLIVQFIDWIGKNVSTHTLECIVSNDHFIVRWKKEMEEVKQ